ncbi:MAG: hypothetical protein ACJA0V_002559, partial [Planctomycetota bacterium]
MFGIATVIWFLATWKKHRACQVAQEIHRPRG